MTQRKGLDLVWPILQATYGTKGILKSNNAGKTEHMLSKSVTQWHTKR